MTELTFDSKLLHLEDLVTQGARFRESGLEKSAEQFERSARDVLGDLNREVNWLLVFVGRNPGTEPAEHALGLAQWIDKEIARICTPWIERPPHREEA